MSNVINMQHFISDKRFNEGVIPFFRNLNPSFVHFISETEAVFILHEFIHLFIFLKFIPNNTHTTLPTLEDSFNDIKHHPRLSKGEWVVNGIFDVSFEKSDRVTNFIKNLSSNKDVIVYLKKEFHK